MVLNRLGEEALERIANRAETELQQELPLTSAARAALIEMADGDGRTLLNLIEQIMAWGLDEPIDPEQLGQRLMRRAASYDKSGDGHYNLISALHKSVRGSDPDASLYWLARMLSAGEDPRFLARRITRMAVEDIGLADPQAQSVCLQAVLYLALAPKSNATYVAYKAAMGKAKQTGSVAPPKHILNAPTNLMKDQGYGADYAYDHDAPDGFSGQDYFPETMERPEFYLPVERGFERELAKRLSYFNRLREKRRG